MRAHAPTVPVIGNLGAVQLNYGCDLDSCREAVAMVGADALALHLNPLQEALQPEGDVDFSDLLPKIGDVAAGLDVPVIAKEVGSGIAPSTARALRDHGVTWIDVAGLGGTSWARIEAARREDVALGELFAGWGIPTPQAIRDLAALDGIAVIGSGGVRSGVDVAKALALGAELVGLAQPFLAPAIENADAVVEAIERLVRTLRIAMFCVGARDLAALRQMPLVARAPWSPFDGAPVNAHTISHPFSSTSQPGTEP
ncbi:MAG: alpha-hydroxy-acid oxidizing protein [Acidobacteriota bacterium]